MVSGQIPGAHDGHGGTGRHVLPLLVLCLLLVLVSAAGADQATPTAPVMERVVRIGLNYPLTGPYSVEGLDQVRAARLAVDQINGQGGILGHRIELLTTDSASDILQTDISIHQLIRQGCTMIFGGSSSAVAIRSATLCQEHQILFFGTLTYSTATTLEHAHRYSFRECSNSYMSAQVLARWLKANRPDSRYFFITANYTWGWTTEESMRQVLGAEDTTVHPGVLTPLGAVDFHDVLLKVAASEADILVLVLFGKDMAFALSQLTELGLKESLDIVVPNLTLGMAERSGARAMEGVIGTLPWTWSIPFIMGYPQGQEFVNRFTARYNRYPSTAGASAYTIVYQYKDAVERAGTFDSTEVIRALEGHSFTLLKDEQTWRSLDHQALQTVYLVRGKTPGEINSDPLRLDFFEIIDSMSGEESARSEELWKELRIRAGLPPYLEPLPDEPGGTQ